MKHKYFTEKERYQLEAYLKINMPIMRIAKIMDKCRQTIYNEIARGTVELRDTNWNMKKVYCADFSQNRYDKVKLNKGVKPKSCYNPKIIDFTEHCIKKKRYSPYVTSTLLKCSGMDVVVCPRTIYNYIYKGVFKNITTHDLPYKRRKKVHKEVKVIPLKNPTKPLIDDRDRQVLDRSIYGHWEMDTVYSSKKSSDKSSLLVLTERMTLEEIIIKMPDLKSESVVKSLDRLEKYYGKKRFREIFKTITCDNGTEFADYDGITKNGRTKLYYCHPYRSSERGSNENQNKLIRRWIKKGEDIGKFSNREIKAIESWINDYPRKLFNGLSSNEVKALILG